MLPTLALALLLPAAPVPKDLTDAGRIEAKFGKVVDPKADSKFILADDRLIVLLPANQTRDLCSKAETAPRLVREIDGDFVLTLRVDAELADKAVPVAGSDTAFLGGGVRLAGKDGKQWVRYGYAHTRKKDGEQFMWMPWELLPGAEAAEHGVAKGDRLTGAQVGDRLEIRLTRRGTQLTTEGRGRVSHGGWFTGRTDWECVPDGPLTVSLFAHHSSDKGGMVVFSNYALTPLKEAKK